MIHLSKNVLCEQTRVCMNVLKCIWRQVPLGKVSYLNQQQIYHGRYPSYSKKKGIHCQVGFQDWRLKTLADPCLFAIYPWQVCVCFLEWPLQVLTYDGNCSYRVYIVKTVIVMFVYSEFAHHSWCIVNILGRMVSYDIYLSYPILYPSRTTKKCKKAKIHKVVKLTAGPIDEHPFWGKQPNFQELFAVSFPPIWRERKDPRRRPHQPAPIFAKPSKFRGPEKNFGPILKL